MNKTSVSILFMLINMVCVGILFSKEPGETVPKEAQREWGSVENNLSMNLTTSKKELFIKKDKSIEPINFRFSFKNNGKTPLKLSTYMFCSRYISLKVITPDGEVITFKYSQGYRSNRGEYPSDYVPIKPGEIFVHGTQPFPYEVNPEFPGRWWWRKNKAVIFFPQKPGKYRFKAVYDTAKTNHKTPRERERVANKVYLIVGSFLDFTTAQIKEAIEQCGGKVVDEISAEVDVVIKSDPSRFGEMMKLYGRHARYIFGEKKIKRWLGLISSDCWNGKLESNTVIVTVKSHTP